MDQTWLENILVRRHSDETPAKVLDLKVTQAVGKGENYLSLVKKINATILLLSGGKRNICLIVKDSHQNPEMKKMTTRGGFFEREITMYRDILPKMEDLIHSMDHPIEPLWPKCYSFTLYDQLVFEDLTARGYKMIDRKLQQDLAHSRLVFTKLGQLHSLSKIILDRFEIPQGNFKNMWCQPGITSNVIERSIAGLGKEIASWGDEWKEILARFDEAKSSFYSRLVEALTPKQSDFLVLNHGDCWSNNMLFKNDEETGHPISMKFIDFQISNIGSPINDLHYFVATSVQPEIYKNHSDELLRTYCDSLKANLTELKYEGTVPGFEELKHKMDDTRIAQFCFGICLTPVIIGDKGDVPDLENAVEDGSKKPELNGYDNLNDRSRTYLKNLVKEASDSDLI